MLNVPNTKDANLIQNLIRSENQLARLSNYNVKMVEKSGIQLSRLFKRVFSPIRCHWLDCPVCTNSLSKGSSGCRTSNVVYEATCVECTESAENGEINSDEIGTYIGETSRTLVERAMEHVDGVKDVDGENFITKHWP